MYKKQSIDVQLNVRALKMDAASRSVETSEGQVILYEKLLFTTGSNTVRPQIFCVKHPAILTFHSADDAVRLKKIAEGKKKGIMIGGGLLSLDVAANLCKLGLKIDVIEMVDRLLPRQLDIDGAAFLQSRLSMSGLTFYLGRKVTAVDIGKKTVSIQMDTGPQVDGDVAVVCAGVEPSIAIARNAGLSVNRGIIVDDYMRTSFSDIWAGGDCAEYNGRSIGLWQTALTQGTCAGASMAGVGEPFKKNSNTAKIEVFGIELISSGIVSNPSLRSITYRNSDIFRRLYLENGYPVGTILIGNLQGDKQIIAAMTHHIDLSQYGDETIDPSFDWQGIS